MVPGWAEFWEDKMINMRPSKVSPAGTSECCSSAEPANRSRFCVFQIFRGIVIEARQCQLCSWPELWLHALSRLRLVQCRPAGWLSEDLSRFCCLLVPHLHWPGHAVILFQMTSSGVAGDALSSPVADDPSMTCAGVRHTHRYVPSESQ